MNASFNFDIIDSSRRRAVQPRGDRRGGDSKKTLPRWLVVVVVIAIGLIATLGVLFYQYTFGLNDPQKLDINIEAQESGRADTNNDDFLHKDMMGREVTQPNDSGFDAEKMNQVSSIGVDFEIESVGLKVPYGEIDMVDGHLDPTNYTAAFGVRNIGVPYTDTTKGTAYVVAHTLDTGGVGPGNYLFDTSKGQVIPRVHDGDTIKIGNRRFVINNVYQQPKKDVTFNNQLWDDSITGRLIFIVCFPNSESNYIVQAESVGGMQG